MQFYSDQGFSEVESSVSLLYNYPVLQNLKLYYRRYMYAFIFNLHTLTEEIVLLQLYW